MRALLTRPPRCTLVNVATGASVSAQINPPSLAEQLSAQYARLAVPGLGHEVLQYTGTRNRRFDGIELVCDATLGDGTSAAEVAAFCAFIRTLLTPVKSAAPAAPPRVLLVWPQVVTLDGVLTDATIDTRKVGHDGTALAVLVTVAFEASHARRARA